MKLSKRYSMVTGWANYQSCRERLEDECGNLVPWWGELVIAAFVPLNYLIVVALERLLPQFASR